MSTEAHVGRLPATEWDGGALPYRVGHASLDTRAYEYAMSIAENVIASETMKSHIPSLRCPTR